MAVHIRGTLRRRADETLRAHLDSLSARFENELRPKPPWMPSKVSPDQLGKLMRSIMPVELSVESVDGTWKLNQNKKRAFVCGPHGMSRAKATGKRPLHLPS